MGRISLLIWVNQPVPGGGTVTVARKEKNSNEMQTSQPSQMVPTELLRRFDVAGPRYTSYPTADRFVEAFDADTYRAWLAKRHLGPLSRPLSLYVHLPFCGSICYYCACNKVVTRNRDRSAKYVSHLSREIAMQSELLGAGLGVVQMHWGGGTPTFLPHAELGQLMDVIRGQFRLGDKGEYSIEIDPRTLQADTLELLRGLGFNRISLGVQDFDPDVQRAVHRIQSEEQTLEAIAQARRLQFRSINLDLMYGLPKQHVVGFNRTLEKVIDSAPDRIAIYNYAHLPAVFKPQRRINESDLPSAETRLQLLSLAIRRLTGAGYVYIGMDHFARPDDELAIAQRQGRLHRNFQGYSTGADCDLIGLGISAIGEVGPTYSQNVKNLEEYYYQLDRGVLPIRRGVELTADDLVRRAVIQCLMCRFEVPIESLEIAHLIEFGKYFATEITDLKPFQDAGLLKLDDQWLTVTPLGRFFIRNICMVFDRYLREGRERARYSKAV
jgi:oxygen-independent coproporphyrinogen-3 oxidase